MATLLKFQLHEMRQMKNSNYETLTVHLRSVKICEFSLTGKENQDGIPAPVAYVIKMLCSLLRLMPLMATRNETDTEIETLR